MGKASRSKAERRLVPSPAGGSPAGRAPSPSRRTGGLTPARTLLIGLLLALVVAGVLIGVSVAGSSSTLKPSVTTVKGALATNALFQGIPQHANVLGNPNAPATLMEFAEPQCPICGAWARDTLPTVVRDYVRTGKLKIVLRPIAFIEPRSDSERALRALAGAGAQNREFQLIDLLYRNQGEERSGWITEDVVRSLGSSVNGLDVERMLADGSSDAAKTRIQSAATAAAQAMGTQLRTPTFLAGRSDGELKQMPIASFDQLAPVGFAALLDQMTSR
jgi:protein-disulfide isomerase